MWPFFQRIEGATFSPQAQTGAQAAVAMGGRNHYFPRPQAQAGAQAAVASGSGTRISRQSQTTTPGPGTTSDFPALS